MNDNKSRKNNNKQLICKKKKKSTAVKCTIFYCNIQSINDREQKMGDNNTRIGKETEFYHIGINNNTERVFWVLNNIKTTNAKTPHTTAEDIAQFHQVCADVYRTVGFKSNKER